MNDQTTAPYTFRCGICNLNWPYAWNYRHCPKCHEPTRGLKFEEHDVDSILSYLQAEALLDGGAPQPTKGRKPTRDEVRKLHDALDDWAHRRPSWMR